ncbi:hypothetical protein TVAG_226500 [Trichomonas vaginalis G3]|uniref:Uncharacterized protein n=1 Tax=Trichomonas vaginalis (strain ATCC PRA-98 / G3) TaxID=412133 RepID=A2ER84_TRIV3|nr:hypothetical protein TVAGG3_0411250 [Trichomonas vaginalis G3]EAY04837.1 hypothetical protein TVAG_226500 [Trichomonas vaginalis G3]KAI5535359.1 hypothetical protein TVAGG3_0411250 [Trichomonas vaginalis G3]|eukprot:XP_001317060.1 hypothetical protein [Trichomonas vaginalis G3]
MGLSVTHDNTVQGKFIDFLEKVVIIELSLVFLFTAVSLQTSVTLYIVEIVALLSLLAHYYEKQFPLSFFASVTLTLLFFILSYRGEYDITITANSIILFTLSIVSELFSGSTMFLPALLLAALTFYSLLIANPPKSSSYLAIMMTFILIIPNPVIKMAFIAAAITTYYIIVSDNYIFSLICLFVIPAEFISTSFIPIACGIEIVKKPYNRSFEYATNFGKQSDFLVLRDTDKPEFASCVIIVGNNTILDQLYLARLLKPEIYQKFIEFSALPSKSNPADVKRATKQSPLYVIDLGNSKGYNMFNLVYDFLNSHSILFNKTYILHDSVYNPQSTDEINPVTNSTFSGDTTFVKSYFGCRLNKTEKESEQIIDDYVKKHPDIKRPHL